MGINKINSYKTYQSRHNIMSGKSDVDSWLATVKDGGVLPGRDLRILCEKMKEILIEESNV